MPPDGSEEAALPSLHALSLSSAASTPPPIASTSTAIIDGAEQAGLTARPSTSESAPLARYDGPITYRAYQGEADLEAIVALVDDELSEPYNLYTYRYFLDDWPHLCFFAHAGEEPIGVIVCKQEPHTKSSKSLPIPGQPGERRPLMRGYLAMLSTKKAYRGRGVDHPSRQPVDEIVLETEADNAAALAFYAKMGFAREKRLHRFYLNGKDAYRLRLDLSLSTPAVPGGPRTNGSMAPVEPP
ncbi:N-alpha-acetyltransferase 30 [Rhodotorula sphaerocarpa]